MNEHFYTIDNNEKSLNKWVVENAEEIEKIELFVYEPTGGYEKIIANFLRKKELPQYRAHANHVRSFAKAMGKLAKTDKIDAKIIAEFAQAKAAKKIEGVCLDELVALTSRREQLIEMKKQEKNRLETLSNEVVRAQIESHLSDLSDKIMEIEKAVNDYVDSDSNLRATVDRITSIPGVGNITAVSILAYLPEIFETESKPLSALSGLAPINKDSGSKQGKRKIYGGRAQIRRVLYMASLSAIRFNPVIKAFYDRLRSRGKLFKVAITAAMRKLRAQPASRQKNYAAIGHSTC